MMIEPIVAWATLAIGGELLFQITLVSVGVSLEGTTTRRKHPKFQKRSMRSP